MSFCCKRIKEIAYSIKNFCQRKIKKRKHLFSRGYGHFLLKEDEWYGASPATLSEEWEKRGTVPFL